MDIGYIKDKINNIISNLTGDIRERNGSERLKDDCGLDSLSIVNLIINLEIEFDIFFDDSDIEPQNINSIEDITKLAIKYINT